MYVINKIQATTVPSSWSSKIKHEKLCSIFVKKNINLISLLCKIINEININYKYLLNNQELSLIHKKEEKYVNQWSLIVATTKWSTKNVDWVNIDSVFLNKYHLILWPLKFQRLFKVRLTTRVLNKSLKSTL